MNDTETKPAAVVPSWVNGAVLMGLVSGVLSWVTHYQGFAAGAAVLLISAGLAGIAAVVRPPTPAVPPAAVGPIPMPTPVGGSLVGMRIRHSGGTSTVTEDLDVPMPRRTVDAVDDHGRPHRLCVAVDEQGRVVEAAVPGEQWAAAQAL